MSMRGRIGRPGLLLIAEFAGGGLYKRSDLHQRKLVWKWELVCRDSLRSAMQT